MSRLTVEGRRIEMYTQFEDAVRDYRDSGLAPGSEPEMVLLSMLTDRDDRVSWTNIVGGLGGVSTPAVEQVLLQQVLLFDDPTYRFTIAQLYGRTRASTDAMRQFLLREVLSPSLPYDHTIALQAIVYNRGKYEKDELDGLLDAYSGDRSHPRFAALSREIKAEVGSLR